MFAADAESRTGEAHTSSMPLPIATACMEDFATFRGLQGEWEALYRRCENVTPFNSWDWLFSWWQSYGDTHRLRIVTFRRDGVLLGVLPLYVRSEPGKLGISARIMRFIGDGSADSDYLSWMVAGEHRAECGRAFIAWLQANRDWDVLVLREMPLDCHLPSLLEAAAREFRWSFRQEDSLCGVLELPPSIDAFLLARQSRFRTKLRSLLKKLNQGDIVFETESPRATLKKRLRSLFELHQARWQQAGQPGVFGGRSKRLFYARFCPRYLRKDWLRLYSLRSADRYLAHQLCFEDRGVVYLLQEGFDVSDPSSSYGQMLRTAVVRHLIEKGGKRYDFLGGYSTHKVSWGAAEQQTLHVAVARKSLRAGAYFHGPALREQCVRWAEALLPASLTTRLKRTFGAR